MLIIDNNDANNDDGKIIFYKKIIKQFIFFNFFNKKDKFGRFEVLFLVIYTIEMVLKITGLGSKL